MNSRPELRLDWCDFKAAEYACTHWHYSRRVPAGKLMKVGAWEGGRYIGCVLYGRGANNNAGKSYGLQATELCELVRIALTAHQTPVSRIVAVATRFLRAANPGLRLVFSYADPEQGHHGGVYQGGNWIYSGLSGGRAKPVINGKEMHMRSVSARYGTAEMSRLRGMGLSAEKSPVRWKHKYLLPLDDAMREQITPLSKPYPKRAKQATPSSPEGSGGATPTRTLHEAL